MTRTDRGVRNARHVGVSVTFAGVRTTVSRARLARLATAVMRAERARDIELSLTLVTAPVIARLNAKHLGHRGATDVLAFRLETNGSRAQAMVAGDVYVCPAVARRNARRFGVSVREELERLVVHGILHALGWDHPAGDGRTASPMWKRQEALLRRWRRRMAA